MTATTGKINFQVGSNHDDLQTLDMNIYENDKSGTVKVGDTKELAVNKKGETKGEFLKKAADAVTAFGKLTTQAEKNDFAAANSDYLTIATKGGDGSDKDDVTGVNSKGASGWTDSGKTQLRAMDKDGKTQIQDDGTVTANFTQQTTADGNVFRDKATAAKGYSLENLIKAAGVAESNSSFTVGADGTTTGTGYTVFDVRTSTAAQATLASIDKVINLIDTKRGDFGALENRMSSTISNQTNIMNNESDARSRMTFSTAL